MAWMCPNKCLKKRKNHKKEKNLRFIWQEVCFDFWRVCVSWLHLSIAKLFFAGVNVLNYDEICGERKRV